MTTGQRMKERRKELGLSAEYVADRLGVSPATIYRYEKGDIEKMPGNILEPISKILNTTPSFLMGWVDSTLPENVLPMPQMKTVPLLGTIACGEPILAAENVEGDVAMPEHVIADFALRCKGDSMIEARIFDGDIVYIRQQPSVENGEIAAVLIGEEATLKRVYVYPEKLVLSPANHNYEPFIYVGEEISSIRILGKAVAFTSAVR